MVILTILCWEACDGIDQAGITSIQRQVQLMVYIDRQKISLGGCIWGKSAWKNYESLELNNVHGWTFTNITIIIQLWMNNEQKNNDSHPQANGLCFAKLRNKRWKSERKNNSTKVFTSRSCARKLIFIVEEVELHVKERYHVLDVICKIGICVIFVCWVWNYI